MNSNKKTVNRYLCIISLKNGLGYAPRPPTTNKRDHNLAVYTKNIY